MALVVAAAFKVFCLMPYTQALVLQGTPYCAVPDLKVLDLCARKGMGTTLFAQLVK